MSAIHPEYSGCPQVPWTSSDSHYDANAPAIDIKDSIISYSVDVYHSHSKEMLKAIKKMKTAELQALITKLENDIEKYMLFQNQVGTGQIEVFLRASARRAIEEDTTILNAAKARLYRINSHCIIL